MCVNNLQKIALDSAETGIEQLSQIGNRAPLITTQLNILIIKTVYLLYFVCICSVSIAPGGVSDLSTLLHISDSNQSRYVQYSPMNF